MAKLILHQGAVGIAIDLQSGLTTSASLNGVLIETHPDTGRKLIGYQVPFWKKIIKIARHTSHAIPLGYIGVDLCIDQEIGPLVLEVNGRPGIEIQNVQQKGLRDDLAFTAQPV